MSFGYYNNLNTNSQMRYNTQFRAQSSPALSLEDSIDKLAQKVDEERNKKHNKQAIAVGSGVLGLSALVMLLNPRFSSKLIEQLKIARVKSNANFEKSKNEFVAGKFYKAVSASANWLGKFVSWTNNYNSVKDTYYKMLCTEEKSFNGIHNIEKKKKFKNFDKYFRKIMKKPHETISKWGDSLAKRTVRGSYKNAGKKMDKFETLIQTYSKKLPEDKKNEIQSRLRNIQAQRKYFSTENLEQRFINQENLMENLNSDIRNKWNDYRHGFVDKNTKTGQHFNQNLSFWAQDIMKPERDQLEKEGLKVIDRLMGNKDGVKGQYRELIEILSENLSSEEKTILEKSLKKTEKSLRNAGKKEYFDYFDKKRDLVLGSAPTDILTATLLLATGGVALASADTKDDRISRLLKGILPTIAGLGTSIALTSMLFSGVKGMLIGYGAGFILSRIGSDLDKRRIIIKAKLNGEDPNKVIQEMEKNNV